MPEHFSELFKSPNKIYVFEFEASVSWILIFKMQVTASSLLAVVGTYQDSWARPEAHGTLKTPPAHSMGVIPQNSQQLLAGHCMLPEPWATASCPQSQRTP